MKRLNLFLLFLIMSTKLFSQTSLSTDTHVYIPIPVAKLIQIDLIEFDALKEIHQITEEQLKVLQEKIVLQDSIISNYNKVINTQTQQLDISQKLSNRLKTDLKKQKFKTKLTGGIGAALLIGLAVIL